jgi:hypothetical protein
MGLDERIIQAQHVAQQVVHYEEAEAQAQIEARVVELQQEQDLLQVVGTPRPHYRHRGQHRLFDISRGRRVA